MPPHINVCIATYKRPEGLKKLLLSLRAQETAGEFSFTISVADNDAQRSAEAVVREFNATGQKIIYDVEPQQNIALARNKSISPATGDYIATIDDDIYADRQWLLNLYRTITSYNADVVHGPVIPEFHPKTPNYMMESAVFNRPNPPTGSEDYIFTAANSLFRRTLIEGVATPFDPQFGRTGGEDAAFFENLKKRGYKHVWCREARVFAFIPPKKTNWRWILQREFRIGNGFYRVFDQGPVDPGLSRAAKILALGKRLAKLSYPVPVYILRGLFDAQYTAKAIERLRSCAFYTGIIAYFLGFQYEEYRGQQIDCSVSVVIPGYKAIQDINAQQIGWKAVSKAGVVAAGGAKAVAAGIGILDRGGNAADAAVATILALTVTDHGACSIGGEAPLLIFDAAKQEVKALCGQGRAPLSQTAIDWYMENGIPGQDDIRMAPVPSVVDLCITTLKLYGTQAFDEVVAPTLALLDAGKEDWHPKLAVTLRRMVEEEQITPGSREEKLQAAAGRFYGRNRLRNDIADDLEAFYIEKGGFLRREDLAAHRTLVEDPVTVNYRGYTVCKCGPWTQGPFLCQALRLLEGFDLKAMGHLSADYVHVVTEAMKLAMADRDEYYGDPAFVDVPLSALLSDHYAEIRRPLIDMQQASLEARPGDPLHMKPLKGQGVFRPGTCGTSTCVVADRWGNVVSATPSANVFIEKVDGGRTGVTYGNRLRSFNTTPDHPNCIEPGKRPRITPSPTLVLKNGKPVLAISVGGGDLLDQTSLTLLLDFIEFGMPPEAAVTAPRFATAHHQNSFTPNLERAAAFMRAGSMTVSDRVSRSVQEELSRRGHQIEATASPIAVPVMLHIDQDSGMLYAAGDPAVHRHAAGLGEK